MNEGGNLFSKVFFYQFDIIRKINLIFGLKIYSEKVKFPYFDSPYAISQGTEMSIYDVYLK